jgi:hypothetical protein
MAACWRKLDSVGSDHSPSNLIFRNVLPSNFAPSGDFVPRGVFCDRAAFINGGAAACFAAAGVALRQS